MLMRYPLILSLVVLPAAHDAAEKGLVASSTVQEVSIPAGTQVRVLANNESHGIESPTAISADEQGNLFIAQTLRLKHGVEDNRDHLYWVPDDVASMSVEDRRKMFRKWADKFSTGWEYFSEKSENILQIPRIGKPDQGKSTVFAEGFNDSMDGIMAGVMAFDGVVYVACVPKLLAMGDRDGDGVADWRTTIADGFGVRVSLSGHDLNGFALGPDGRIWGTMGDRGLSFTTREGKKYHYPSQGAVFRFEPDGSGFEVVHTGLRNPKEIDFDDYGNAISVDNNSDQGDLARIVYIVEGADSGWTMGHQVLFYFPKELGFDETPGNLWMTERRWELANDEQPAFLLPPSGYLTQGPSGLIHHPGTGFLESEAGNFFVTDYAGEGSRSGVWSFGVEPDGAGMKPVSPHKLVWGITPTDIDFTPDGRVLISDYEGGWTQHAAGRILELKADQPWRAKQAQETAQLLSEGMKGRGVEELGRLLKHPDRRVRMRAQLELTRSQEGFGALQAAAEKGEGLERLHGIWGLGIMARRGAAAEAKNVSDDFAEVPGSTVKESVMKIFDPLLRDSDPEIRAQVIKTIGDIGNVGDGVNYGLLMADESKRVRFFAAIAAGRGKAVGSLPYVWQLLEESGAEDAYLRHAGSYALSLMAEARQLTALRTHESTGVRLGAVLALARQHEAGVAHFLQDQSRQVRAAAIRAIHDQRIEGAFPALDKFLDSVPEQGRDLQTWRRLVYHAYDRAGEAQARWLVDRAMDAALPMEVRAEILTLISKWIERPVVDGVTGEWVPPVQNVCDMAPLIQPKIEALAQGDHALRKPLLRVLKRIKMDDSVLDSAWYEGLFEKDGEDAEVRLLALEQWLTRKPEKSAEVLQKLAQDADDEVARGALVFRVHEDPATVLPVLTAAAHSKRVKLRQTAWILTSEFAKDVPDSFVIEGIAKLKEAGGIDPVAVEILDAARARKSTAIATALADYQQFIDGLDDPLAPWREVMLGGDAWRGAKIFDAHPLAQCRRCHRGGETYEGGDVGPNLGKIGLRHDRRYLLEALVLPSATVAPGYGVVSVTLKSGETLGGTLIREDADEIELDQTGDKRVIRRDEVKELTKPVSAMPPMGDVLKPAELRDVLEFLTQFDK